MSKKIRIYSTPTCTFCVAAKQFFAENDIEFTEHNVATDMEKRTEMIEKTGQMGVPVIEIDDQLMVGFNEAKMRELLGL